MIQSNDTPAHLPVGALIGVSGRSIPVMVRERGNFAFWIRKGGTRYPTNTAFVFRLVLDENLGLEGTEL